MLIQELQQKVLQKFNIEISEEDINNIIQIQTDAFKEGVIRRIPIHLPNIGKWVDTNSLRTRIEVRQLKTSLKKLENEYPIEVLDSIFKDKLKEKAIARDEAIKKSNLNNKANYKTLEEVLDLDVVKTANNIIRKL
jgi:hypothetical protein